MARVELIDVTKRFGDTPVIEGCSLTVADKEFLVLVGPSGCGKSTLLRIVAGLETATSGQARIGDKNVGDLPPKDRDIAMVFQNYALYPHMSVYKNMAFGLKMRNFDKREIDRRVREAAAILEMEDLLNRRPAQLSGGQRQRVAMGRAIVRKPAVFLFDEPLSNLDAKLRGQMRLEIKQLHERLETTVIYVTHDQVEAMTLAGRIAVIEGGVIQQVATPDNIYNAPVNRFVAGFIGSPQMNFLPATIRSEAGALCADADTFSIPIVVGLPVTEGREVILGIRPEHLSLVRRSEQDIAIEVTAEVIEPLGAQTVLFGKSGDRMIAATLTSNAKVKAQQNLRLFVLPSCILWFDAKSGQRMSALCEKGENDEP